MPVEFDKIKYLMMSDLTLSNQNRKHIKEVQNRAFCRKN